MQPKVYALILSAVAMSAVGQIALKIAVERAQLKEAIAAGMISALEDAGPASPARLVPRTILFPARPPGPRFLSFHRKTRYPIRQKRHNES